MNEELKYALAKFKTALAKLKEGANEARDELQQDGVIQRFEFSFELLWKTLRIFLQNKGITSRTPRDAFQEAFRLEWLDHEAIFLDMLEDRNKTSHIYDKETSRLIFGRIKEIYVSAMEQVLEKLKSQG